MLRVSSIKRNGALLRQRLISAGAAGFMALSFGGLLPATAQADGGMGTIVQQSTATNLPSDLASIAMAKRIIYVTSNVNGKTVNSSGLIITPNVRSVHPNVVAWAHALTGMADKCAPSVDPANYFFPEAVAAVKSYLQQGWVVAATDYAGMGVGGNYQALVGDTAARNVIDSVRAARNLDISLTADYAIVGDSGGGGVPLFAGEISSTYGVGLNLKGVVGLAPLSNTEFVAPSIVGTPFQGELVAGLYGLAYADPTIDPGTILAAPAKNLTSVLHTGCVFDIINVYAGLTPSQLLVGGQLPDSIVAKFAQFDDPGYRPDAAPMLLLQGLNDQEIPPVLTEFLQQEVCAQGSTSYLQELSGVGHSDLPIVTTGTVSSYLQDRFNGVPAPSNC